MACGKSWVSLLGRPSRPSRVAVHCIDGAKWRGDYSQDVIDNRAPDLTLLFDGGCPLCLREVDFLRKRDLAKRIAFVDIDSPEYVPHHYGDISYRSAMGRIHAITADGSILQDVAVFREAYRLIGLGWIYAPTRWPLISSLIDRIYSLWASRRLQITGRPDLDSLCRERCKTEL